MNREDFEVAVAASVLRDPKLVGTFKGRFKAALFTDAFLLAVANAAAMAFKGSLPLDQGLAAVAAKFPNAADRFDTLSHLDVSPADFAWARDSLLAMLGGAKESDGPRDSGKAAPGRDPRPEPPSDSPPGGQNRSAAENSDTPEGEEDPRGESGILTRRTPLEELEAKLVNYDAEQALLGAVLANETVYSRVQGFVKPEDFADPLHGRIFWACGELVAKGVRPSPISLKNMFDQDGALKEIGGAKYLVELAMSVVSILGADDFARAVADLASRRNLLATLERTKDQLLDFTQDSNALIAQAMHRLPEGMGGGSNRIRTKHQVREAIARKVDKPGVFYPTGIAGLDDLLGGGFFGGKLYGLAARFKAGKALPMDAKVLTRRGWKAMRDVQVGDSLASVDGRASRIEGVFPQGIKEVWEVTFSDGRKVECSPDHLWSVGRHSTDFKLRTIDTRELARQIGLRRPVYVPLYRGDHGVRASSLPLDPYLLGAILGDGGITGNLAKFSTADADMVSTLNELLPVGMELRKDGTDPRRCDYRIVSKKGRFATSRGRVRGRAHPNNPVKDALAAMGLMGKGSHEKWIPEIYLETCRDQRLDLLRGLLDTDGFTDGRSVQFCTTSPVLASQVRDLVWSLGGICRIAEKDSHATKGGVRKPGRRAYICNIRYPRPAELFLLRRKRERAGDREKQCRLVVKAVRPVRRAECQCIKVSHPSGLFITDGYVVTHNTALSGSISHALNGRGTMHGFAALEMTDEEIEMRDVARDLKVNSIRLMKGTLAHDPVGGGRVIETMGDTPNATVYFSEPGANLADLRAFVLQAMSQFKITGFIVDYHQLIGRQDMGQTEEWHLRTSAEALQKICKQFGLWCLLVLQLNQEGNARGGEGIKLACDGYMTLVREKGSSGAHVELELCRYKESASMGSTTVPGLIMDPHGPHFTDNTGSVPEDQPELVL